MGEWIWLELLLRMSFMSLLQLGNEGVFSQHVGICSVISVNENLIDWLIFQVYSHEFCRTAISEHAGMPFELAYIY